MSKDIISLVIIQVPIILFSVIIHECAHGWMAERCGDDTARVMGRITLNPLPHIDLFGTIIIPLFLIIMKSGFLFGYAKPVPVNPYRFNNPRRDMMLVSLAGPASNILLAIGFAVVLRFLLLLPGFSVPMRIVFAQLFAYGVIINIMLALINLIPIPPLDGSGIIAGFLSPQAARQYDRLRPYGFFILIFLVMTGAVGTVLSPVMRLFIHLLLGGAPL